MKNTFLRLFSEEAKKEQSTMARPQLTERMLASVRSQVRAQSWAGKGIFSIEQLENDAIIGLWNDLVNAEREAEALTLKTPAPATSPAKAG